MADTQIGRPGIPVRTRVEPGPASGHVPAATHYLNMAGIHVKDILTIPKRVIMGRVLVREKKSVFFHDLLQFLLKPQAHSNYKKSALINIPSGSKLFNISNLTTTKSRLFLFKICKLHKINKVKVAIRHYQVQMTA